MKKIIPRDTANPSILTLFSITIHVPVNSVRLKGAQELNPDQFKVSAESRIPFV